MVVHIIQGDALTVLKTLPDASVQIVCTSPPYFGLRDYETATWKGGDPTCDHLPPDEAGQTKKPTSGQRTHAGRFTGPTCWKCGAARIDQQIGLEATPDAYIAALVGVFREVKRVLRDDGTVWLNLGDSYAANRTYQVRDSKHVDVGNGASSVVPQGLKPKDLLMMPARVALALQADGWWLRSDIIWSKANPMPESVIDRCTSSHEHIFMLTKAPRYFFDAEAVREEGVIPAGTLAAKGSEERFNTLGVNSRPSEYKVYSGTRNIRDVWTIATAPYPNAHFATFPPELAERCIKAGTSERGACASCGAPWVRQVERASAEPDKAIERIRNVGGRDDGYTRTRSSGGLPDVISTTTDWKLSCTCPPAEPIPCTILDCFGGAGTTGLVADRLGRDAILIELNAKYVAMAEKRITSDAPLFTQVAAT